MTYAIGQEIGYCRWCTYGPMETGFSIVSKINGHGHILLANGMQFDKHGNQRGEKYSSKSLVEAETLRRQLAYIQARRDRNRAVDDLLNLIQGQKTGNGNYV